MRVPTAANSQALSSTLTSADTAVCGRVAGSKRRSSDKSSAAAKIWDHHPACVSAGPVAIGEAAVLHECSSATVSDGLWNASRARTSSASCRVTGRLARLRLVAHRPVRIALSRRMNRREATNSPSLKICDSQPTPPPWNRTAEALGAPSWRRVRPRSRPPAGRRSRVTRDTKMLGLGHHLRRGGNAQGRANAC